jgi:TolA-binding protein
MRYTKHWAGLVSAMVLAAAACTSKPEPNEPSTYGARYSAEQEQERAEFMRDTEERVDKLDREIAQLQTRLQHESRFVSAEERAEWRQDLFELEQDRREAQERLNRARNASPEEWREMRGDVASAVDGLESAVGQVGYSIRSAFAREESTTEQSAGQQSGDDAADPPPDTGQGREQPAPAPADEAK